MLCGLFAVRLLRSGPSAGDLARWWAAFFGAVGAAALLGGLVHGFLPEPGPARAVLWRATLLAIGAAAFVGWGIGGRLLLAPVPAAILTRAAGVIYIAYAAVVIVASQRFWVAVLHYVPAALFLGAGLVAEVRRGRPGARGGLAGLALTLLAAAVQQTRLAAGPLDHNTLYHLVQAIGLWLMDRSVRAARAAGP